MNFATFFEVADLRTSLFWIFVFLAVVAIGILMHHKRKKHSRPHLR